MDTQTVMEAISGEPLALMKIVKIYEPYIDRLSLRMVVTEDGEYKSSYSGNNIETIEFKDISNGTQKTITGIVRSGDYSYSNTKTRYRIDL